MRLFAVIVFVYYKCLRFYIKKQTTSCLSIQEYTLTLFNLLFARVGKFIRLGSLKEIEHTEWDCVIVSRFLEVAVLEQPYVTFSLGVEINLNAIYQPTLTMTQSVPTKLEEKVR